MVSRAHASFEAERYGQSWGRWADRASGMAGRLAGRHAIVCVCLTTLAFLFAWSMWPPGEVCLSVGGQSDVMVPSENFVLDRLQRKHFYNRSMPLVFIGGMPRSGTTLLRVLLDAHPDVRCGEETRVIPRILGLKNQMYRSPKESRRLKEAGVTRQVVDSAVAAFTLEVIARHGEPAALLCNKDPFTLRSAVYLRSLFPASKFILVLRDGRAVVHSIISRKVTITGMDLRDYRQCLRRWSAAVQAMHGQCRILGPRVCLLVHYEHLVLHPEASMRDVLKFLDLPWDGAVLRHDQVVGKPGGISLSVLERSTDQVIKPINTEALTKWVGQLPEDVVRDMPSLAPMLVVLGYDPRANPPDYGRPDALVAKNTWKLKANKHIWERKEQQVAEKRDNIWRTWLHMSMKMDTTTEKYSFNTSVPEETFPVQATYVTSHSNNIMSK